MPSLRPLRRYAVICWADRALLLRAFIWLAIAEAALRLSPDTLRRWAPADNEAHPRVAGMTELLRARRYARWLDVASRYHPVKARCLHRSLVLQWWLRREGLPSRLRIGVRKEHGELTAHAWVEVDGQVVNDRPADIARFTPLARPVLRRVVWQ